MQQLIPEMLLSILILKCVLSFTFPCTQTRGKSPSTMNLGTTLRYLEHNCWEIMLNNATIYIDPIMSQLNFGVPILYRGDKKVIDGRRELLKLASTANVILISQGFGDHAHAPTLRTLISLNKKLSFICPLSALSILTACGVPDVNIQVLKPSQSTLVQASNGAIKVTATRGALLGPPGGTVENGYILQPQDHSEYSDTKTEIVGNIPPSIYYEPHCFYDAAELAKLHADVVITPVSKQRLLGFTLVDGGRKAMELARILGATVIVPMRNGDLEQSGLLSSLLSSDGTEEDFAAMAAGNFQVLPAPPGQVIHLPIGGFQQQQVTGK